MMKLNPLVTLMMILFFSLPEVSWANVQARLDFSGVTLSGDLEKGADAFQRCDRFRGTYEKSTVWLSPNAEGGSGSYEYSLVWRFGSGYREFAEEAQFERRVKPGRRFGIFLPALRDDVPYVQQTVLLVARDRETGETANAQVMFTVSRKVILLPTKDPAFLDQDCFERLPAYESTVGVLTNGSTNLSNLVIKQGVDRIWGNSSGTSWGFYLSPLTLIPGLGTTLGGLFTLNRSYFSMVSKQASESVEVSTEYQLSPGDTVQIYTQKTRYISHYDAVAVDACGTRSVLSGVYPLQWWGFAYHAVPLNPFDPHRPDPKIIGGRPINTCPAALTPDSGDERFQFYQTNS